MPHVDIKYTSDLKNINFKSLFTEIENVINKIDSTAGDCKSRAYPTMDYLHTHIYIHISLLKKSHRDVDFMKNCIGKIENIIKPVLPKGCYYSVELNFSSDYYITSQTSVSD